MTANLQCINCEKTYNINELIYHCGCGGLIQVNHSKETFAEFSDKKSLFDERSAQYEPINRSGVWRFRELILPGVKKIITHPEGNTNLYHREQLSDFANHENLFFKHEGENPTGSFKDRGMTVAITQAVNLKKEYVGCASTGNTSAALAAYAGQAGLKGVVFLPAGKVATGKLTQSLGYGAKVLAVRGDFDAAMHLVREAAEKLGIYMVNSLNPFRLEGQKSIIWEIFQNRSWQAPDWIVVPGGNLGNTSAFGKAIHEAFEMGWINKKPKIATIQAKGANPFKLSYDNGFESLTPVSADTLATAIRIGNPVNFDKAKMAINNTEGIVIDVTDDDILAAKREIDRCGVGCEPASACSLAGVKILVEKNIIKKEESVVGILTGHILKDPEVLLKKQNLESEVIEIDPIISEVEKHL